MAAAAVPAAADLPEQSSPSAISSTAACRPSGIEIRVEPAAVGAARVGSLTICGVLVSRFCVLQTLFNVAMSFLGPLFCFWFLFSAKGPYALTSGPVSGAIIASPFASAVISLSFAPLSMVEAADNGWFGVVRRSNRTLERISRFLCFLGEGKAFRRGVARHALIGCFVAVPAIPVGLAYARMVVAGPDGMLEAWDMIIFSVTYIAMMPLLVMPLGLLGFALEPNFERVRERMVAAKQAEKHPIRQLVRRALVAPCC